MTSRLHRPQILLTGASGVLGSVVAAELAPVAEVTCLTRRRPVPVGGVHSLAGDLTRPDLGLARADLDDLQARIDVVVHCGAMTAFTTDGETPTQVNRDGTARILELVAAADAGLVHVSTAFVDRADQFAAAEPGDHRVPVRSPQHYLRSKIAAEESVTSSGLPVTVVRPSVLIGDTMTGAISQFQGWHQMCAGFLTGRLPFLPAEGSARADCVPVDLAARAVARLALAGVGTAVPSGSEWWLTAGAAALSIETTIDACLEVAIDRGLSPDRPRLLPPEMVERLVLPAFGASAPPRLLKQMLEGMELMRLFGSQRCFPRRWPDGLDVAGPDTDTLESAVFASLDYLADVLELGRRVEVA